MTRRRPRAGAVIGALLAAVVLASVLALAGQVESALGVLTGALAVVVAAVAADAAGRALQRRRGEEPEPTLAARLVLGRGADERDRAIASAAAAATGIGGLAATSLGSFAVLLGADAGTVVAALPVLLVACYTAALVIASRRL